jgi:hypothetical protein
VPHCPGGGWGCWCAHRKRTRRKADAARQSGLHHFHHTGVKGSSFSTDNRAECVPEPFKPFRQPLRYAPFYDSAVWTLALAFVLCCSDYSSFPHARSEVATNLTTNTVSRAGNGQQETLKDLYCMKQCNPCHPRGRFHPGGFRSVRPESVFLCLVWCNYKKPNDQPIARVARRGRALATAFACAVHDHENVYPIRAEIIINRAPVAILIGDGEFEQHIYARATYTCLAEAL